MALFTNATEKASAELRKLQEARAKLAAADLADRARLAEFRAGAGDVELAELLDGRQEPAPGEVPMGSPAQQHRWSIFSLEEALAGRAAARPKLMEKIREAVRSLAHERAEVLRKEAAKLQAKLDAHKSKIAEHTKALQELDGVSYRPQLRADVPPGTYIMAAPSVDPGTMLPPLESVSMRLQREVGAMLAEADRIEAAAVEACRGGQTAGDSLPELLAAIADRPLAPLAAEVESWYNAAVARVESAWEARYANTETRLIPMKGAIRATLAWSPDGEILPQSGVVRQGISAIDVEAQNRRHWDAVHAASRASR